MPAPYEFTVYRGSEGGKIVETKTKQEKLGADEILIKVTHSGLCGTDVHYRGSGCVLGHEGAGTVEEIGSAVDGFKKGERVGWGYQHDSCGHCLQCLSGNEVYCPEHHMYGEAELDMGSLAEYAIFKAAFIFKIPEGLTNEEAAPMMCGGATVFAEMYNLNVRPSDRVGIVGVGGLGHLAIQFASKMGCDVVVFSGTDSKKEEATKLGANEFYATKGLKELELKDGKKLDWLFATTSSQIDWGMYMTIMNPLGSIVPLGISGDPTMVHPYTPMLMNGLKIVGTIVASRHVHIKMLEFAARNGVKPMINEFPLTVKGIEEAFDALDSGKMRYRGVLKAQG